MKICTLADTLYAFADGLFHTEDTGEKFSISRRTRRRSIVSHGGHRGHGGEVLCLTEDTEDTEDTVKQYLKIILQRFREARYVKWSRTRMFRKKYPRNIIYINLWILTKRSTDENNALSINFSFSFSLHKTCSCWCPGSACGFLHDQSAESSGVEVAEC